jgi:hypothetical protein
VHSYLIYCATFIIFRVWKYWLLFLVGYWLSVVVFTTGVGIRQDILRDAKRLTKERHVSARMAGAIIRTRDKTTSV